MMNNGIRKNSLKGCSSVLLSLKKCYEHCIPYMKIINSRLLYCGKQSSLFAIYLLPFRKPIYLRLVSGNGR